MMTTRLPIDSRSDRLFWEEQHKRLAEQVVWLLTANELLRSFELLVEQAVYDVAHTNERSTYLPAVAGPSMLLGGLAIENLLKAVRVGQLSQLFDTRGAFVLDTHDLIKLATDANITLTPEEHSLLERLWQFVAWGGKYPIPIFSEAMRPRTLPNGSCAPRTSLTIPTDFALVLAFSDKLKAMLPQIPDFPSQS